MSTIQSYVKISERSELSFDLYCANKTIIMSIASGNRHTLAPKMPDLCLYGPWNELYIEFDFDFDDRLQYICFTQEMRKSKSIIIDGGYFQLYGRVSIAQFNTIFVRTFVKYAWYKFTMLGQSQGKWMTNNASWHYIMFKKNVLTYLFHRCKAYPK